MVDQLLIGTISLIPPLLESFLTTLLGWHGILALECMSLGKPVITYIAPDLAHIMEPYSEVEGELPVLSATPVTFENVLREALQDSVLRERVGKRARKVRKNNLFCVPHFVLIKLLFNIVCGEVSLS